MCEGKLINTVTATINNSILPDIDECNSTEIAGFECDCVNTDGSYLCLCNEGYQLGKNGTCGGKCKSSFLNFPLMLLRY